jgi:hypothetical protein
VLRSEDLVRLGNLISRRERELRGKRLRPLAAPAASVAPLLPHDLSQLSTGELDRLYVLLDEARKAAP